MIRGKDVLSQAYAALRQNRRRSALTMLGMAWGIATVVLLLAYGTGFSTAIVNIFKAFASMQAIGIAGGRTSMQAGGNKAGANVRLTNDDIDRVMTNVPQVIRITPESFYEAPVSYEGRSYTWHVSGGNLRAAGNSEPADGSRAFLQCRRHATARACLRAGLGIQGKTVLRPLRSRRKDSHQWHSLRGRWCAEAKAAARQREQYQPRRLHSHSRL